MEIKGTAKSQTYATSSTPIPMAEDRFRVLKSHLQSYRFIGEGEWSFDYDAQIARLKLQGALDTIGYLRDDVEADLEEEIELFEIIQRYMKPDCIAQITCFSNSPENFFASTYIFSKEKEFQNISTTTMLMNVLEQQSKI